MSESRLKPEWLIERQGKKAVLYAGLLHLAHEDGLKAITTRVIQCPHPSNGDTTIVEATVETAKGSFAGIGDATPENVGRMVAPHAIRMAETRAKARALRDALDISFVTLEELGDLADAPAPTQARTPGVATTGAARVDADLGRSGAPARPQAAYLGAAGPSPRQLEILAKFKVPVPDGLTRATASDLIAKAIEAKGAER